MTNSRRSLFQHLSSDEMIRYKVGRISVDEKHLLDKHLSECSFCKEAMSGISKMDEMAMFKMIRALKRRSPRRSALQIFSQQEKLIWIVSLLIGILLAVAAAYFIFLLRS